MRKINIDQFIENSMIRHNNKYSYIDFNGLSKKCRIICPLHGIFEQIAYRHLEGRGCQICGGSKLMDWNEIVAKANIKHKNKYEYPAQSYKNGESKIKIICNEHGKFNQSIYSHLVGRGCPNCAGNIAYTKETLIKKLKGIHNDKYLYDICNFKNNNSLIGIKCPKHGWFKQKAANHIYGQGCRKCSNDVYSTEKFINICNKIHDGYYDYKLVVYENYKSDIEIVCPKHGIFIQNARTHFRGSGCSSCRLSKAELKIESFLKLNSINYIRQKKFNDCFYINKLPFDFYLPDLNACLEYDGYQHFYPIKFFGGERNLEKQKIRDEIKNNYCLNNNIKLYRIKYNDDIDIKLIDINEF